MGWRLFFLGEYGLLKTVCNDYVSGALWAVKWTWIKVILGLPVIVINFVVHNQKNHGKENENYRLFYLAGCTGGYLQACVITSGYLWDNTDVCNGNFWWGTL